MGMKIRLNPGVSKLNVFTYVLIMFADFITMDVLYSYATFILESPIYYDLTKK